MGKWIGRVVERARGHEGEIKLSNDVLGPTLKRMEDSVKRVEAWERWNEVGGRGVRNKKGGSKSAGQE